MGRLSRASLTGCNTSVWFKHNRDAQWGRNQESLTQTQTIVIHRRTQDFEYLISCWSIESNMSVASWGEFSSSMKDISTLTSFPMYGNTHATRIVLNNRDQEKLKFLNNALSNSRAFINKATYITLLHYFKTGKGKNCTYQVEAMLSY